GSRINGQLSVFQNEPCPARAKSPQARSRKLFLETGKRTKRRVDRRRKVPLGLTSPAFFHQRPKQRVVPVSAAVVSDRHADVFWDGIESFQQVVDGFGLQ